MSHIWSAQMPCWSANKLMTLQAVMSLISHEINQRLGSTILNAEAAQPILQVDPPNLEEVRFSVRNEPARRESD